MSATHSSSRFTEKVIHAFGLGVREEDGSEGYRHTATVALSADLPLECQHHTHPAKKIQTHPFIFRYIGKAEYWVANPTPIEKMLAIAYPLARRPAE